MSETAVSVAVGVVLGLIVLVLAVGWLWLMNERDKRLRQRTICRAERHQATVVVDAGRGVRPVWNCGVCGRPISEAEAKGRG